MCDIITCHYRTISLSTVKSLLFHNNIDQFGCLLVPVWCRDSGEGVFVVGAAEAGSREDGAGHHHSPHADCSLQRQRVSTI